MMGTTGRRILSEEDTNAEARLRHLGREVWWGLRLSVGLFGFLDIVIQSRLKAPS